MTLQPFNPVRDKILDSAGARVQLHMDVVDATARAIGVR